MVAGKVLDYMASKTLIIGADQGLPEGIDAKKAIIVANKLEDWESSLEKALENFHDFDS